MKRATLIVLGALTLFAISNFQNCGGNPVAFKSALQSLKSTATEGGGNPFDGKPDNGKYCRMFDSISCQANTENLQSMLSVDNQGLHLIQDNCSSTSLKFLLSDSTVAYTKLLPDYIGLSRGVFKSCEMSTDGSLVSPTDMPEAFCTSTTNNTALVINKNLANQDLSLQLNFLENEMIRSVSESQISKLSSSSTTTYSSNMQDFNLVVEPGTSQTRRAHLTAMIDEKKIAAELDCRIASPDKTIILEQDLELSPTWIDTNRLVGYWKMNELLTQQGTVIKDSSRYSSSGVLETGNDGFMKNDASVQGGAISFDGVDDHISIPHQPDGHLEAKNQSLTYMVWIKKTGNAGLFDQPIWHGGSSYTTGGYDIECGSSIDNGCYAQISDGLRLSTSTARAKFVASTSTLVGRWVFLTAVIDRKQNQLRTYLDGVPVAVADISKVASIISNQDFKISEGNYTFLGSLDDVAVWNEALSEKEILEIFQRLRPKFTN